MSDAFDLKSLLTIFGAGLTSIASVAFAVGGERQKRSAMERDLESIERKTDKCEADTKREVDALVMRIMQSEPDSAQMRIMLARTETRIEAIQSGIERLEKRLDRRRTQTAEGGFYSDD